MPVKLRKIRGRLLAAMVASAAAALSLATAAHASLPLGFSGNYTFGSSGCPSNNHVDPVNVLFRGTQAYAENVANQVQTHAGWSNGSGSTQWLWVDTGSGSSCRQMNYQRASGGSLDSRFHIRLWWIPASGGEHKKTAGDAHHEDFIWYCPGHAVDSNGSGGSGFDQGRWAIRQAFINGGHYVDSEYWGNTANFHQCDGDWAASNGNGLLVSVYHTSG